MTEETAGPMSFPVDVIENLFIRLGDGTRLAARLWCPAGAGVTAPPVPAILEYIPYRKRDGTRGRDAPMHGAFAAAGYAAIRVDMRGSGDSDGYLDDEYLRLEQDDALEVIAWIAAQPWCSGTVGMMGKSWGGFNALQVAARRPPALKAIITVCSTDDRFADDIHFMGGCLLNDNLWWGSIMLAYQGRPPDPAIVGASWRSQWLSRLHRMPFWPALWLTHQHRDAYWRHGSVCEDWDAIACPVLAIGGWADAYTNAVPRLLEHLRVPRLGIIGPWAHLYPHDGYPGPAIDFLGEAVRWWDHWLKGRDTGLMDEPMLRAFVEDHAPPATSRAVSPGRFVGEASWPSPAIGERRFGMAAGRLVDGAGGGEPLAIRSPLFTGTAGGEWMGTGITGERAGDQRPDDASSLLFDTGALDGDVEVLGNPVVRLALSSDHARAQVAVRLCDVAPDGSSLRVSYAVLNLAHRSGSAEPRLMVPGGLETVVLPLKMCGHRFGKGHRIRLAVSTGYWPLVWPAPDCATLTVDPTASALVLPVRSPSNDPDVRFAAPTHASGTSRVHLADSRVERRLSLDLIGGRATYETVGEGGLFGEGVGRWTEIDTTVGHDLRRYLTVTDADALSATSTIEQTYRMERAGWSIRIETRTALTGTAEAFRMTGTLRAFENDALVCTRDWSESIPRRWV